MYFADSIAAAIRALDEHWDGGGHPYNLSGEAIPLPGHILCLAQTVEIFFRKGWPEAGLEIAQKRTGTWFDPAIVAAFERAQR